MIYDYNCPNCGGKMERGCVNAQSPGVTWLFGSATLWKRSEKLQSESSGWWPFRSSTRPLRALRCRGCTLVIFWYTPVEQPKSDSEARDAELDAFILYRAQDESKRDSTIKQLLRDYQIKLEATPEGQLRQIAYNKAVLQADLTQAIDFDPDKLSREQLIEQFVAEYGVYLRAIPIEALGMMLKVGKLDRETDNGNANRC